MLAMYQTRPDAFNEDELLRVSTLKETREEKEGVYRTILHYFPQSKTAANNLAVILLGNGNSEQAEAVLESVDEYSPEMLNTRAALYVYRNDSERAIELLRSNVELPQARYNLALLEAQQRRLDEAWRLMDGYRDVNSAIVALSVNRNEEAASIMDGLKDDDSALASYVRALIAARSRDTEAFYTSLEKPAAMKTCAAVQPVKPTSVPGRTNPASASCWKKDRRKEEKPYEATDTDRTVPGFSFDPEQLSA